MVGGGGGGWCWWWVVVVVVVGGGGDLRVSLVFFFGPKPQLKCGQS